MKICIMPCYELDVIPYPIAKHKWMKPHQFTQTYFETLPYTPYP